MLRHMTQILDSESSYKDQFRAEPRASYMYKAGEIGALFFISLLFSLAVCTGLAGMVINIQFLCYRHSTQP